MQFGLQPVTDNMKAFHYDELTTAAQAAQASAEYEDSDEDDDAIDDALREEYAPL